jgi:hypothetical protein
MGGSTNQSRSAAAAAAANPEPASAQELEIVFLLQGPNLARVDKLPAYADLPVREVSEGVAVVRRGYRWHSLSWCERGI